MKPDRATRSPTAPVILVVDDDRGLSRLVEKALHREGYVTAGAGSFQEAVDWLEKHQPDLMLLDLQLEDIGGKELIDHLTVNGRSVPFIIITGQGDERVAVAMMKRGAMDYMVKDVDFLQFVPEVVRRALGQLERDRKLVAAEEALRRSEANLAKAQQIAHLGSFELGVLAGTNDYRSDEIFRILGLENGQRELSSEEYVKHIVYPKDRFQYRQVMDRAVREAAVFDFEYRVVRPDGSIRHVHSVGEPVFDASSRVAKLVGTLLDITDRKRAELRQGVQYATTRALAESTTLAEAAPQILRAVCEMLDWDLGELWEVESNHQFLRCVETWQSEPAEALSACETAARQTRFEMAAGLPGRTWANAAPVWSSDVLQDTGFTRSPYAVAAGLHAAVGFPIRLGSEVLGAAVFYSREVRRVDSDLMQMFSALGSQVGQFLERKRAEEGLRREHAFSSAVLDTSAALVVVLDRSGRIVRFNRACEQTTGYSYGDVKGRPVWEIFLAPGELESVREVFERTQWGDSPSRHENHWITRQGERRLISWSNSALTDDHGAIEYVISVGIDITERRRLEQEILQISEMEQRRIGQDLHDGLCQHLAATELMSEILEQKLARKSKADAARVAEIGRQVRDAISQTRLLARGLSPVVVESEGLMSALQEMASYTERMFRVRCEFRCERPVLVHDHAAATHLYRIAQEAISNAIRHGKAKRITISLEESQGGIGLTVLDDGIGLPRDPGKVKGIGLRIMQYRAGMMGGSLLVQARPEGGTSVTCSVRSGRVQEAS